MANSLFFKIKPHVRIDNYRLIEMFFMDYIDDTCDNQVKYKIESAGDPECGPGTTGYQETFRVDFDKPEDTLAVYLRGIPKEFQMYLEFTSG